MDTEIYIAVAISVISFIASFVALTFGAVYVIRVRNISIDLRKVMLSLNER